MTDWQPIETAPKDGRHIMLYGTQDEHNLINMKGEFAFSGYWDAIDESWCGTASTWVGPFYSPTHWQPLPSPPELMLTANDEHEHTSGQHWCPECGPL